MSFYERLTELISEKGLTIRKVERDCGLANASIKRWMEQSPRLESVVTVANYLQTSIDYLALGDSDKATNVQICNEVPLSRLEDDLVAMFRDLPKNEKEIAFQFVTMLCQRAAGEKGYTSSDHLEDDESAPA